MTRKTPMIVALALLGFLLSVTVGAAADREIAGVNFSGEKTVADKQLKLNGVALRTKFFIKVFVGGFYLENPTQDAEEAITSEQVKHFHLHYLTSKATAEKLQDGFKEAIIKANPPAMVEKHMADIERYASWLDQDMAPGATSLATYVPGKGLTLVFKGQEKGTIANPEFAQMYFRYNLGAKADKKMRKGYLGK
ncbi:MAG: chalcone isomerase family protein [Desulfobacterales bacterium]|nr:chalcone isomerase family protein [Desulfobacterales bacterium]MDJ0855934.1 chalcone isomerase family protein [Desulfobacterales bacterium]MDJ0887863.1 chalcone isomerase family protein [Desulfobacterales bacterium]MDJ0990994.1 chalcone isomerase family protein [Desulfobacterales bacterium]